MVRETRRMPVVGSGREAELGDGALHLLFTVGVEFTESAQGAGSHLDVAELAGRVPGGGTGAGARP